MHLPWRDIALVPDLPAISTSVQDCEIAELMRLAKGRRVLEFGSAYGYSAIAMALAGATHVDSYDPHSFVPGSYKTMTRNVADYGVAGLITMHLAPSSEARGSGYGLVFIDGDHSREAVLHDLALALRVAGPGGVIACHDYGEDCCCPGVRQALDEAGRGMDATVTGTLWVWQARP